MSGSNLSISTANSFIRAFSRPYPVAAPSDTPQTYTQPPIEPASGSAFAVRDVADFSVTALHRSATGASSVNLTFHTEMEQVNTPGGMVQRQVNRLQVELHNEGDEAGAAPTRQELESAFDLLAGSIASSGGPGAEAELVQLRQAERQVLRTAARAYEEAARFGDGPHGPRGHRGGPPPPDGPPPPHGPPNGPPEGPPLMGMPPPQGPPPPDGAPPPRGSQRPHHVHGPRRGHGPRPTNGPPPPNGRPGVNGPSAGGAPGGFIDARMSTHRHVESLAANNAGTVAFEQDVEITAHVSVFA